MAEASFPRRSCVFWGINYGFVQTTCFFVFLSCNVNCKCCRTNIAIPLWIYGLRMFRAYFPCNIGDLRNRIMFALEQPCHLHGKL
ncbi:hypothetical protein L6452_06397 [Arctium lappa]|uniref:Uncharacterized protein n=1 Tax=Arctium lappa TaxID=4217 RepID=A0ACB9EJI0_ARCLA|nr:hypothetical protein L6452_06397 [Arctium lappa]